MARCGIVAKYRRQRTEAEQAPAAPGRARRPAAGRADARAQRFAALATIAPDDATRFRLAAELAQNFERYQAYRRDLLEAWERGAEAGDWQAEVWRRLVQGAAAPHRARLIGDWIARYHDSAMRPPGLPPRLAAFGCINVSPDVLRFLGVVAQHAELDFYLPSPCRQFWGDVRRGDAHEIHHEGNGEDRPAAPDQAQRKADERTRSRAEQILDGLQRHGVRAC